MRVGGAGVVPNAASGPVFTVKTLVPRLRQRPGMMIHLRSQVCFSDGTIYERDRKLRFHGTGEEGSSLVQGAFKVVSAGQTDGHLRLESRSQLES